MFYIGIDVGGMSIKGGIVTADGKIICDFVVKTKVYDSNYSISEDIALVIDGLLKKAELCQSDIVAMGIGQPGSVDSLNGIIRYSNNIALTNIPVIAELKKKFSFPMFINNDANCAVLGEYMFGSGKGYKDIVFITLGTGVGSGIMINGELFEGKDCAGAEAGHTVIVRDGNNCNCGRKGCWETYASASALMKMTKKALDNDPNTLMHKYYRQSGEVDGKMSFQCARLGDTTALRVVEEYVEYISIGLINLANIFRPDIILIGGGISHEGEYLTTPLQKQMDMFNFGAKYNPKVKIDVAQLKNSAGILGAVSLAILKK